MFLDGHDLRQLNLKWLRSQLGVVQQEPALFACSVRENIRYGREGASDAEVEEAAKAANVHDFVTGFPGGYDTEVGERGVQLSGGQKQRVAIARTMLRNPRVCILDEATSALDMASEKVVQAALEKLMQGRCARRLGSALPCSAGRLSCLRRLTEPTHLSPDPLSAGQRSRLPTASARSGTRTP